MRAAWAVALVLSAFRAAPAHGATCLTDQAIAPGGTSLCQFIKLSSGPLRITTVRLAVSSMTGCDGANVVVTYVATGEAKSKGFSTAKTKDTNWAIDFLGSVGVFELLNDSGCALVLTADVLLAAIVPEPTTTTTTSAITSTASTRWTRTLTTHSSSAATTTLHAQTQTPASTSSGTPPGHTSATSTSPQPTASASAALTSATSTRVAHATSGSQHTSSATTPPGHHTASPASTTDAATTAATSAVTASASASPLAVNASGAEEAAGDRALRKWIREQAAVTALVAGVSGAGAGPALRLVVVAGGCRDEDRFAGLLSPLGWTTSGSEALGAFLGNLTLAAAAFLASFVVATATHCAGAAVAPAFFATHDPHGLVRFPSFAVAACLLLFPGCTLAAWGLVLHTPPADAPGLWVLGCGAVALCSAVPFLVRRAARRAVEAGASVVPDTARRHPMAVFLLSEKEWVSRSRHPHTAERYATLLRPYRFATAWYPAAEFAACYAAAAIAAAAPRGRAACGHVHVALTGLFAALLGLELWFCPHLHARSTVLNVVALAGLTAATAAEAAAAYEEDGGFAGPLALRLLHYSGVAITVRVGLDVVGGWYSCWEGGRGRVQLEHWSKQWTYDPAREEPGFCDADAGTQRSLSVIDWGDRSTYRVPSSSRAGGGTPSIASPRESGSSRPGTNPEPGGGPMVRHDPLAFSTSMYGRTAGFPPLLGLRSPGGSALTPPPARRLSAPPAKRKSLPVWPTERPDAAAPPCAERGGSPAPGLRPEALRPLQAAFPAAAAQLYDDL